MCTVYLLEGDEWEVEMAKPWSEMRERVGLEVVEDEEVEQNKEDREVEKIIQKGKETKRKLAMGKHVRYVKQHTVQYICQLMISCQTGQTVYSTVHLSVNDIKINECGRC